MWEELINLASTIELFEDDDELTWQFQYLRDSTLLSFLFKIINFREVLPPFTFLQFGN
jgi:hypothetical protein